MKCFLTLIVLFTTSSCSNSGDIPVPEKVSIARKVRFNAAKKISRDLNLRSFGSGGAMMYQVDELCLAFMLRKPIDMDEGRRLVVKAVQIFLDEVNSNEDIRPYLTNYPFEPKNIELMITIQNEDGSNRPHDQICLISNNHRGIQYAFSGSDRLKFGKRTKETFEEAETYIKKQITD